MKTKTFESYLMDIYMEECPMVLDDDIPDGYIEWLSNMDIEEIIEHANKWGEELTNK